jgi:hypothetical protein
MRSETLGVVRSAWAAALLGVLAIGAAGCGASDFPNEPRAPAPFETTASIGPKSVSVSPNSFGAGITVFTVANLAADPASFEVKGCGPDATTGQIQPGGVATLKAELTQGTCQAIAGGASGIKPAKVHVGPERKTSQNKVLEP